MIPDLARAAESRHGTFVRADAKALGLSDEALRRLVATEEVRRETWGGYVVKDGGDALAPLRLACRQHPDSCLTHQSALMVHGFSTFGLELDRVHLARCPESDRARPRSRRKDLAVHVLPPGAVVRRVGGLPVVDPLTAGLQLAAAGDLTAAVVALDQAIQQVPGRGEWLARRCVAWNRRPGASRVLLLPQLVDGRSESPGETRSRLVAREMGLRVTPQVWIDAGRKRFRVDLLDDSLPLIIEFDGALKYDDDRRAAFEEKVREDALRSLGYSFARLTWADLMNLERAREIIGRGLALARRSGPGHPGRIAVAPGDVW